MAYNRTNWNTGDPITQERMNNIEQGIVDAHSANQTLDSTVADIKNTANTAATDVAQAKADIVALQRDAATTSQSAQQGTKAWTYVKEAMETDGDTVTLSLNGRLNNYYASIQTLTREVTDARKGKENLKGQMDDIDTRISGLSGGISSIENQLTAASLSPLYGNYDNISVRLSADETRISNNATNISNIQSEITTARGVNGTTLDARFNKIETDISDAKSSTAKDTTFKSVDARLEDIESEIVGARSGQSNIDARLDNIEGNISGVSNDKIDKTSIANNLTTTAAGYVLDARQGKTLNNAKVNYTDVKDNLVSTDTDKPLSAKQGKVLDEKIAALTNTVNSNDSAMDTRVDALEENVNGAKVKNGPQTLDARFDAVEGRATTLESNVQSIANELGMIDGTAIKDTNTKIDALEAHVQTMATELDMVQSGEIVNTNTRVDKLENRINAVDGENGTIAGLTTRMGTAEGNIATLTNDLNAENMGLKARMTSAENRLTATENKANAAATTTDLNNLTARVKTLEGQDTVIISNATFDTETGTPIISGTPSEACDYLIKGTDDKYYYWRYFGAKNGWQLISGAGGGNGTSSGLIVNSLPNAEDADENTDYFVYDEATNVYLHYRFTTINNTKQAILIGVNPDNVAQYALSSSSDTETNKNYIDFYKFNYGADTAELDQGTRIAHIELVGGGGGGTFSSKSISRITPRSQKQSITFEDKIYLRFFYTNGTANESDNYSLTHSNATTAEHIILGGGEETITSGDPKDASTTWPQSNPATGFYAFDVTNYCKTLGKQTFTLKITDPDNDNDYIVMKWEITLINLSIESTFPQTSINNLGESITFNYVPNGDIDKTVHFYLGETEIDTRDLTASQIDEQTFTIPAQTVEGAYQLRVYLTANNGKITSEPIYRDLIWKDSASDNIILSSPYRGRTTTVQQYSVVEIPYAIAGNSSSYIVKYYVNDFDNVYNEITLTNTSSGKWTYRPLTQGQQHLRIKVNDTYIDFTLNVEQNVVDIAPYTTNLILNFDPTGLSNNSEQARQWTNGTYHLTVSDNFDWFNGGYGADETGEYFLVKSGTRAYFDYKMFMQEQEQIETSGNQLVYVPTSKVYQTGQEMKIIFKTSAVRAIDAIWFTNTKKIDNKDIGIQLSVHEGFLKTDTASDTAVGEGDEQVAATNTYLYFPYSEEDRIELDININKENSTSGAFTMSYEDGVPSKAYAYTHNQRLYHDLDDEAIITIGSDDCDVYIYKLRIYNNELTPAQVLRNFIADGKTVEESIQRYQRNCIYYDVEHDKYSPYLTSGFTLDAEALAPKIPSVKVLMMDAPTFTLNKKSFIKGTTLRCIHADGPEGTPYRSRGAADNWFFENGYHAGQGTTSDKYGDAGRNLDFLFNCDGSHKPSDKVKNPDPNYISKVTTGYGTAEAQTSVVNDWKGDSGKIALTSTSIPNNFFNFKVNIASSENVNNALLQKRYNDFLPYIYQSPAYLRDNKIKNDMEFVPAVLFVRENSTTEVHSEFNDTKWHFYALGNLGDSKKTDYTRAYDPDDMNEFTIEISDNNTNNSQFQTGVYLVNGTPTLETFEAVQDIDDEGELIDGSYTAQGRSGAIATTDYIFPLDTPELKAMWNAVDSQGNFLNKNHWSLVNEPYDGDHSFEMRYACKGDYRDGKKVNDTTGQADAQLLKNSKVWQAFYSWVVTSSNEEFVRDLDQWCVRNAVEFWYAFTHYYTMMDSRAKNTFWHFAKTGKYRKVTNPVEDLFQVYKVSENATLVPGTSNEWTGTFTKPSETFNASNTYYTEYAFDLWDYDNDTALGIDNNGELIFPYGKEDKDYRMGNDPASGYVFNGAGSVFWRRLRDLCTSEISNIFHMATEQFFSAENLIQQFDEFQECFPEALWQLDIQRKYIRPFTGDTSDGSKTRQSKRFLESMMQGRKKYQRRQWIKDQYYYFGSKYKLNNITEDFFYLDCYTGPDDALIAELLQQGNTTEAAKYVGSNWDLTITPYQDMYINASFGETAKSPVRAKAGEPIEMTCPFTSMNNTRIYIYGASRLKALAGKPIKNNNDEIIGAEGLASLYIGVNSIERTDKLQHLYLGTEKTTYRNANLTKLTLNENSPILETLDIRNCGGLAGELKLGGCNNLRILEAEGTNITLATLPSSSQIVTLHLPSTITSLSLSSARNLNNFYMKNTNNEVDYSNLRSLLVDNSDYSNNINWISIAKICLDNLNYLYLLNLSKSSIDDIIELEPFAEKKTEIETQYDDYGNLINKLNLSGFINVTGEWSEIEKDNYETIWKNLTLNVIDDSTHKKVKHKVTYRYNGTSKELYVNDNTAAPDIYKTGLIDMPTKESTPQFHYRFGSRDDIDGEYVAYSGWKRSGDTQPLSSAPVIKDDNTILDAYFVGIKRQYYVRWFAKPGQEIYTIDRAIGYGEGANLEAPTIKDIHAKGYETCSITNNNGMITYSIFTGWEKLPINIDPDGSSDYFDIYGVWDEGVKSIGDIFNEITELTPLQLLTLSILTDTERATYGLDSSIDISTSLTYKLGQDNTMIKYNAHTIVSDTAAPLYLNGTTSSISTTYQPLLANSDAFTFAIDYALSDATYDSGKLYAIIASCYYSANGVRNGFGIFKNLSTGNIEVGFGDMYRYANQRVAVSNNNNATMRNIIVLRHPKDSPTLYIYSGLGTTQSMPLEQPYYSSITRSGSSEFNSGAVLNIGQLIGDNETLDNNDSIRTSWTRAKGTIYWAKYWEEDLGIGECKRIAEWPHENITLAIAYMHRDTNTTINRIRAQDNVIPVPTMYLATRNNLLHGLVIQDRHNYSTFVDNRYSWEQAEVRKLCNSRLLYSLPTALQSILCKADVASRAVEYYTSSNPDEGGQYRMTDYTIATRDYLYVYSATNLLSGSSKYNNEDLLNSPFAWRIPNNVELYNYNASNQQWAVSSSTSDNRGQYFNLRFPGKAFGKNMRVFKITTEDSSGITSIVESIGKDIIKDGDIYIEGSTAYIYISNKEMNRLGLSAYLVGYGRFIGVPDNEATNIGGGAGRGGWLRAEDYWTRSLISNGMNYTIFSEVQTDGTVNVNNISTSTTGYKVNYIIAI